MKITTASRAHRILRYLSRYKAIKEGNETLPELPGLSGDDSWMGIYYNREDSLNDAVAFSAKGVSVNTSAGWKSFKYRDIASLRTDADKSKVYEVYIALDGGEDIVVPIRGARDRTRNAFEVLRFLMRVVEDLRRADIVDSAPESIVSPVAEKPAGRLESSPASRIS